jgi:peroxiredoxin
LTTAPQTRILAVGDRAPDFTLKSIGLKEVSLRDYRGRKNVVLLFYPLDWTPG